jgi:plasmid stabilization system protein ParE
MRAEYTNRALSDLRKLSVDSRRVFGDRVAAELEVRIRAIVERICQTPESAPLVEQTCIRR